MAKRDFFDKIVAMKQIIGILLALGAAQVGLAVPGKHIGIGNLRYAGNGCPQNSVDMALSSDGSALSVLFSNFVLQAGGATDKQVEKKSCTVSILVDVPTGFRVTIAQFDYRGFTQLPVGARASLDVRYVFLNRGVGHARQHQFKGPLMQNYAVNDSISRHDRHGTSCQDRQATFQISPKLELHSNSQHEAAVATLDSLDSQGYGLRYHVELEPCI